MKHMHARGSRASITSLPRATAFSHTKVITPTLDRTGERHPQFKEPKQFGGGLTTKHEDMNATIKLPVIKGRAYG